MSMTRINRRYCTRSSALTEAFSARTLGNDLRELPLNTDPSLSGKSRPLCYMPRYKSTNGYVPVDKNLMGTLTSTLGTYPQYWRLDMTYQIRWSGIHEETWANGRDNIDRSDPTLITRSGHTLLEKIQTCFECTGKADRY